mgnify:CR=1 FL=1
MLHPLEVVAKHHVRARRRRGGSLPLLVLAALGGATPAPTAAPSSVPTATPPPSTSTPTHACRATLDMTRRSVRANVTVTVEPKDTPLAAIEARIAGSARILVRPSGTQSLIRVMVEADDEALLDEVMQEIILLIEDRAKKSK